MDSNTQKVITYLTHQDDVMRELFCVKNHDKYIEKFIFNKTFDSYSKNVQWCYQALFMDNLIIGVNTQDMVIGLNDKSESIIMCDRLENLPYEVLRLKIKNEINLKSYMDKNLHLATLLKAFEAWAYSEKIFLDFRHVYHSENGQLFETYFE